MESKAEWCSEFSNILWGENDAKSQETIGNAEDIDLKASIEVRREEKLSNDINK